MKKFGGKVLFLDRANINTDEIIPAKYLTEIDKEPLKQHLLEDLDLNNFDPTSINFEQYGAVVSRANFGCGSSREMAPWAFEVNGINVLIASNFARIFRENTFNCGMLAIELSEDTIDKIFQDFADKDDVLLDINLNDMTMKFSTTDLNYELEFSLTKFQHDLVKHGGWVKLAADKY
ncbi:MAG: 3-isopropylmalate dehydratase small subunit [Candidatus Lokiarchaeota archaeon]|nr:3-isopropylmalate dehydratase small subunit [Candidatus Lokiarchaeota archaeon]